MAMADRNVTALLLRKYRWTVQAMVGHALETEMQNLELRAPILPSADNERTLTRFASALIKTATANWTKRSDRRCANPSADRVADNLADEAGGRVQARA